MKRVYYDITTLDLMLQQHIIRGDRSDGIPNIHSSDDCLVNKVRQTPITSKIENRILNSPQKYCEENNLLENYKRNKLLIDFDSIPDDIRQKIIDKYIESRKPNLLFKKHV
jgi:hypothetical protein